MSDFTIVNLQDLATATGLTETDFLAIGQGDKALTKATIQQVGTFLDIASSVKVGDKDTAPTEPSFAFAEAGVYPEWGNVEIIGNLGILTFDGTDFSKSEINFVANGVVEKGNTQAVSGDEVNRAISYDELFNRMELPTPFENITLINSLGNNNFTSVWGGNNKTNISLEDNVFTFIATAQNGRIEGVFPKISGHKYYLKLDVKSDSNEVMIQNPGISGGSYHTGSGDFERLSFIFTSQSDVPGSSLRVRDGRASGWTNISVKKGMAIDLTEAYGAGNEPSIEEFEALLSEFEDYWFGTEYTFFDKNINNGKSFFIRNGQVVLERIQNMSYEGKKIAFFGSSTTEFGDWVDQVGRATGAEVLNFGFGGTRLVDMEGSIPNYDDISMKALTEAIMSGNWSTSDTAIENLKTLGDNNEEQYNLLKSTNFNDVDLIFIMYATNDYKTTNLSLGSMSDTDVYRNFTATFKYIIESFSTNYPTCQIILAAPIIKLGDAPNESSDDVPGTSGSYLYEFADRIGELAKKYHFPFLDLYNKSGINKFNGLSYIADGTHPNQRGYNLIADKVIKFLNSN